MPQLIDRNGAMADRFAVIRDCAVVAELPPGPVIVPLALWLAARIALLARGDVGVWLAPADDPALLAADVALLPVIAVDFPAFADGRGYSSGRLLRERFGYRGELRAIGDIQRDQLHYLWQVGFDAFALLDDRDVQDALKAFDDFSDGYQLTQQRTPWFRRRADATPIQHSESIES
jgi:uncharacterized protein (DUF934 family)